MEDKRKQRLKYYAVMMGKIPGIYRSWDECKAQVNGVSGARYKSFPTEEEALAWMERYACYWEALQKDYDTEASALGAQASAPGPRAVAPGRQSPAPGPRAAAPGPQSPTPEDTTPYAFVDGSYNQADKRYGYGGFLVHDGIREILQGSGSDPEMASMRNVAGEILGSQAAIAAALERGLPSLRIYYDYAGIEMWAVGDWKRNRAGTVAYYEYVQSVKDRIRLEFVKVKGHSGVEGNEEADRLAKEAVGII